MGARSAPRTERERDPLLCPLGSVEELVNPEGEIHLLAVLVVVVSQIMFGEPVTRTKRLDPSSFRGLSPAINPVFVRVTVLSDR